MDETNQRESAMHVVAAAVLSVLPESSSMFAAQLFAGIVQKQFQKDCVENRGECGAFFGNNFVVATAIVSELKPALRAIRGAVDAYKPLNQYPIEIAFFDVAEGFWRTVHPVPAPAPFGRLLTDEVIKASRDKCAHMCAWLDAHFKNPRRQDETL